MSWQSLKGGAVTPTVNAKSRDEDDDEKKVDNTPIKKPKKSPSGSKRRHVAKLFDEASPPKRSKLLNEYKQKGRGY